MSRRSLAVIGDLIEPVLTWTPERDQPDGAFTYIDLSAVDQDAKVIAGARELARAEAPSRARQIVRVGDILVSTVRPNLNGVARVPRELDGATASTGFCVLRPKAGLLDDRYLFHWVKSPGFVSEMTRRATGASYPAVSDRVVCESKLPLPLLPEQRRIAAILDKADALRAKRREALAQLDLLTQSIFIEMFGDPISEELRWPSQSLTDVCYCYSGGTPSKAQTEFWEGKIPWFSAKDLKTNDLTEAVDGITEDAIKASRLKLLPSGTVLIVVRGMILAHTFPVSVLRVGATINQDLKAVIPRLKTEPEFLAHCLRCQARYALSQVSESAHGTKRLDSEGLAKLRIPHVPEKLQLKFSERAKAIAAQRQGHLASLNEMDALFSSLQHRAFRGEL
ncbi:MAG: restriction endonuclease subunit S [Rhodocyclaceae bacterium]|nr:restriction endonuclease subunit S [Rhodocyclaceae bacterium]